MDDIVCATRGGEGSRAVQTAAIQRAEDSGNPLVFLYVASPGALHDVTPALHSAVREELIWLGKALLNVAERRARARGINARTVICEGDVREEISNYLIENHASVLLLGAPRGTTAEIYGDDAVERFASSISARSGVAVDIVRPDSGGNL